MTVATPRREPVPTAQGASRWGRHAACSVESRGRLAAVKGPHRRAVSATRRYGGRAILRRGIATLGAPMVQKVTEVVGTSAEGFAKAAENAVSTAAKTVRNIRWFRVSELEGSVKNQRIAEYHATVKIYFDLE